MTDPSDHAADLAARAERRLDDDAYAGAADALSGDVDARLRAAARHTTQLRAAVERLREVGPFHLRSRREDRGLKALYAAAVERLVGHALRDLVRQLDEHEAALVRVLDAVVEELEQRDEPPGP